MTDGLRDEPFYGRLPIRAVKILGRDNESVVDINQDGRGLIVSPNELNKIRLGERYIVSRVVTGVADQGQVNVLIDTNGINVPHIRIGVTAGGDLVNRLFEDTQVSANGTELSKVNRNRNFTNATFNTRYFYNPTVTNAGTQLTETFMAGGSGVNFSGGSAAEDKDEFVFGKNDLYLLRLTNVSGSPQTIGFSFNVHEEDI